MATPFDAARGIANAVLYEGYLLYPYTASASKNKMRWQFGVVVPKAYEAAGTGEHGDQQTEMLFDATGDTRIDVLVRFLHVEARIVEALRGEAFVEVPSITIGEAQHLTFDETVECEVPLRLDPAANKAASVAVSFAANESVVELRDERGALVGRTVRRRWPLTGTLDAWAEAVDGNPSLQRLRIRLENHSDVVASSERGAVLRTAFISAHTLLAIENGAFISPVDPPDYAEAATETLANRHTWPILMGDGSIDAQRSPLALSSPIVLGDFPEIGKKTESDAFDATEIDELLTLSVLSLSDAERAEARATDPRARAIVDRAERFGAADIARLHDGDLNRDPYESRFTNPRSRSLDERLADPFATADFQSLNDGSVEPFEALPPATIVVNGVTIEKGSSVTLAPKRRADAWDTFLAGKVATVRAIHQDLEDKVYVAVTVDDDPASDLHDWYGRAFFFEPDEVEPVEPGDVEPARATT
jgi:hypothetical protein